MIGNNKNKKLLLDKAVTRFGDKQRELHTRRMRSERGNLEHVTVHVRMKVSKMQGNVEIESLCVQNAE